MSEKVEIMSVTKKRSRIFLMRILEVGLCTLLFAVPVVAANEMKVVEHYTGDDSITLYVKDVESSITDVTVQIGKTPCENIKIGRLSESRTPIRTLIMLDNSLSVPVSYRLVIMDMLQAIITEKNAFEEIAIATFDEQMRWLSDYTSDAVVLDSALKNITYQDLETYLTDVLYEVLANELTQRQENVYYRIIVISDGVDNKPIGYIKDELYALMKNAPVPIYTLGIQTGKNDEQLEKMFAISRVSNADYFLLDETDDYSEMLSSLEQDQKIIKIEVTPEDDLLDGSVKAVKVLWNNGESISTEIRMPQVVEKKPEDNVVIEEVEEENADILLQENPDEDESDKVGMIILIVVTLGIVIMCAIAVLILRSRRTKPFEHFQSEDERKKKEEILEKKRETELKLKKRNTVVMFENKEFRDIILIDVNNSLRTFRHSVKNMLLIGAESGCDIVVDWDEFVSGKHCRITVREGRFYLSDVQSTNGTFVNQKRITKETEIYAGNVIQIGDTKLRFEVM